MQDSLYITLAELVSLLEEAEALVQEAGGH